MSAGTPRDDQHLPASQTATRRKSTEVTYESITKNLRLFFKKTPVARRK
ncbi:MAG: hypothetical protein UY77_C0034G0014 [Candidatus Uhrbacteria bacterium GW2011_GWA2_53_10]|uniref:Uncharacterized protein n=1 Tax=Candidatus Uhrbacteria bacterium GW2011_GWA2_53_10 TaxID=1618980 RepID=A0A0G2AHX3_9BACT|nr:MAG: hypothetical protein UY77_C0034G0014 [Candidatus Uhrbacteria bacterium GW2011_GWA2_53_10]